MDQVLKSSSRGKRLFCQPYRGKVLVFDEETKKISQSLSRSAGENEQGWETTSPPVTAYQLSDLLADQDNVHFSEDFRNLAHDLTHPEALTPSDDNQATLRDYQETGVKWFSMLEIIMVFGGILADDMGLGKTLQTISLLDQCRKKKLKS